MCKNAKCKKLIERYMDFIEHEGESKDLCKCAIESAFPKVLHLACDGRYSPVFPGVFYLLRAGFTAFKYNASVRRAAPEKPCCHTLDGIWCDNYQDPELDDFPYQDALDKEGVLFSGLSSYIAFKNPLIRLGKVVRFLSSYHAGLKKVIEEFSETFGGEYDIHPVVLFRISCSVSNVMKAWRAYLLSQKVTETCVLDRKLIVVERSSGEVGFRVLRKCFGNEGSQMLTLLILHSGNGNPGKPSLPEIYYSDVIWCPTKEKFQQLQKLASASKPKVVQYVHRARSSTLRANGLTGAVNSKTLSVGFALTDPVISSIEILNLLDWLTAHSELKVYFRARKERGLPRVRMSKFFGEKSRRFSSLQKKMVDDSDRKIEDHVRMLNCGLVIASEISHRISGVVYDYHDAGLQPIVISSSAAPETPFTVYGPDRNIEVMAALDDRANNIMKWRGDRKAKGLESASKCDVAAVTTGSGKNARSASKELVEKFNK